MANCLTMKNTHRNAKGRIVAFTFLITTNLIHVPVSKMAIISFKNQAFGNMNISKVIRPEETKIEELYMRIVFYKKHEAISIRYTVIPIKATTIVQ